ncbi:hypothetical protein [Thermaurantiacus sp.]
MVGSAVQPVLAAKALEPVPRTAKEVLAHFEALVVEAMLKASRPQGLQADGLAGALSGAGDWQDLIDRHLARLVAARAPFGLAQQLEASIASAEAGLE